MRLLRSFPTRRSSDLEKTGARLSMSEIDADAGMSAWQDHTIKAIRESYVAAGIPAELADKMGGNTEEFIAAVTPYPEVDHYFQEGERSEEHTSELQSRGHLVCRLLLVKKNHE